MEYTGTKKKILEVSLDLFSKYGYEATSISMIADAVGMKKPSIYSHFSGKQDIFDKLIELANEHYVKNTLIKSDNSDNINEFVMMPPENIATTVKEQVKFLVHDPVISKVRKFLTIEQYRNQKLCETQECHSYSDIYDYHYKLIESWISGGMLVDDDPQILTLSYISPITIQLQRIDRNPKCEDEALAIIEKHIIHFYNQYRKKENKIC